MTNTAKMQIVESQVRLEQASWEGPKRRTMSQHQRLTALGIAAALLTGLVACRGATSPQGQVLARVNGRDITTQDLAAEARASGVQLTPRTTKPLLDRVIDRQLLADSAHHQSLDATPNAPSDLNRLQQDWHAHLEVSRLLRGMSTPAAKETQDFIASNPFLFQRRTQYHLESIEVTAAPSLEKTLKSYKDFGLAAAFIRRLGIAAPITKGVVDSGNLAPDFATRMSATLDGQFIEIDRPDKMLLLRIISRESHPLVGDQAVAIARGRLERQSASSRISSEILRLKSSAQITYQAGYAPRP